MFRKHEGEPTATTRLTSRPVPSSSADLHRASLIESVAGARRRPEQRFTRALAWDESERHSSAANRETEEWRFKIFAFAAVQRRASDESRRPQAPRARGGATSGVFPGASAAAGGGSPGRLRTRPTVGMEPEGSSTRTRRNWGAGTLAAFEEAEERLGRSQSRKSEPFGSDAASPFARRGTPASQSMGAGFLWQKGFSGSGVKMGVFDTGVRADHRTFASSRTAPTGRTRTL